MKREIEVNARGIAPNACHLCGGPQRSLMI
jgi:hypothetical protein